MMSEWFLSEEFSLLKRIIWLAVFCKVTYLIGHESFCLFLHYRGESFGFSKVL